MKGWHRLSLALVLMSYASIRACPGRDFPTGEPSWRLSDTIPYESERDMGLAAQLIRNGLPMGTVSTDFGVHRVGYDSLVVLPVKIKISNLHDTPWGKQESYVLLAAGRATPLREIVPWFVDSVSTAAFADSALVYWGARAEGDSFALYAMRYRFRGDQLDSLRFGELHRPLEENGYRVLLPPMVDTEEIIFLTFGTRSRPFMVSRDFTHFDREREGPQLRPPEIGPSLPQMLSLNAPGPSPAFTVAAGSHTFEFGMTRLIDLQRLAKVGAMSTSESDSGRRAWQCYTLDGADAAQRLWFLAGDQLNSIDEVRAEILRGNVSSSSKCPSWPRSLRPLALDRGLWLGSTRAHLIAALGEPSAEAGDRILFEIRETRVIKDCCVGMLPKHDFEMPETYFLEVRLAHGRVASLRAGGKDQHP